MKEQLVEKTYRKQFMMYQKPYLVFKTIRCSLLCVFLISSLLISSCKKKDQPLPVSSAASVKSEDDAELKCADLPKLPPNQSWIDTTVNEDKNINSFFYNPYNPNQIIYVANGDLFGYNKIYAYDIPSKQATYLCDNGDYVPSINNKGWLVFNRSDLNIYKIKINGDSLTKLTSNSVNSDPKWNRAGNIFYYRSGTGNQQAALVEMDPRGNMINNIQTDLANTAVAHTSNKIAYLKSNQISVSIYYKDLATNSETLIVSVPVITSNFQTTVSHLTFDSSDKNIYWSNENGIFKSGVVSGVIETIAKNCGNLIYDKPVVAGFDNELTFSCHVMQPLGTIFLLHKYKPLELDLNLNQLREVNIFP